MKSARLPRIGKKLPKRGNSFVSISVVDENGFVIQYDEVEVPNGALKTAVATIHLEARRDIEIREETARCFGG